MLNRYYGWYVAHRRPRRRRARAARPSCAAWAAKHGKPIIITEYGADTVAGPALACAPQPWTEEYQADLLDDVPPRLRPRRRRRRRARVELRRLRDGAGVVRVDGNKKGVFTRDRRPKAAAHALRRRWRALAS